MHKQNPVGKRRSVPYPGIGTKYLIPNTVWQKTLHVINRYRKYESEGLVFWGGSVGASQEIVVQTVYIPNHPPQGWRASPEHSTNRTLVRQLSNRDEKLIAQVHSHPGEAFHSWGDDERAASFHPGYISIVVPDFGLGVSQISDCGVFEYSQGFIQLSKAGVQSRFIVFEHAVVLSEWNEPKKRIKWNVLNLKPKSIGPKKL